VCEARLDNRPELVKALKCDPAMADGDLILAAYHRWGTACLSRLVGDFAFVLWDERHHRLLAARDPMNMRPLAWRQRGKRLWLASDTEQLLPLLGASPAFDRVALAGWAGGWPDPNLSLFEEVELLPPGQALVAENGDLSLREFWRLEPQHRIRYANVADYEAHFRELLDRAVADRLRSPAPLVATQMSGGMDSTSVTALAARHGKELLVISHAYEKRSACDERPLIEETLRHLRLQNHRYLETERYLSLPYEELYPPVVESPGTVRSPRYREELSLVREEGARVLLTGSGGDELTWGHALTYAQRLKGGELGVVAEVVRGCRRLELPVGRTLRQLFLAPLLPASVSRLLGRGGRERRLPSWIVKEVAREAEPRLFAPLPVRFDSPALQARYEALMRSSTFHSVRSHYRVAREVGVEVRHPFFDTRLVAFSFAVPESLWNREGYPKWLLRRAMQRRLPAGVCWNRNKVIFDDFFGGLIRRQADRLRPLLARSRLADLELVETAPLLALFDAVVKGSRPFTVDLLYALMTEVWLRNVEKDSTLARRKYR